MAKVDSWTVEQLEALSVPVSEVLAHVNEQDAKHLASLPKDASPERKASGGASESMIRALVDDHVNTAASAILADVKMDLLALILSLRKKNQKA